MKLFSSSINESRLAFSENTQGSKISQNEISSRLILSFLGFYHIEKSQVPVNRKLGQRARKQNRKEIEG